MSSQITLRTQKGSELTFEELDGNFINLDEKINNLTTALAAGVVDSLGTVASADLDLSTGNFFEVTADDQTLTFSNPPAVHGFTLKVTGAGTVTGYNLSVASNSASLGVSSQDSTPEGLAFNGTGTKMYMVGSGGDRVYQYTLSTPYDLGTAAYDSVFFSVAGQESGPTDVTFNGTGTKMYICGQGSDSVHQYTLSTPYDLSTASYDSISLSVASQDNTPHGVGFSNDGVKMYIVGNASDSVYQYTLSTPYDLSTASYDSISLSVAGQDTTPLALAISNDGFNLFIVGNSSGSVHQYSLSTAYDLSTASYDNVSFSVSGLTGVPFGLAFSSDGTKMYAVGSTDIIYEYTTGSVTASTITYPASVTFEAGSPPAAPAIGAVKTVDLYTVNGGTNYYDAPTAVGPAGPAGILGEQYYVTGAAIVGDNVQTTPQSILGVGVTLESGTIYEFVGNYNFFKTAGTTSHRFQLLWGGTATVQRIVTNVVAVQSIDGFKTVTSSRIPYLSTLEGLDPYAVAIATTSAFTTVNIQVRGIVAVTTGGTLIPQYSLTAAPGGAYTAVSGNFLRIRSIGTGSTTAVNVGDWA